MSSQAVLMVPKIIAPDLDEAFLPLERWLALPSVRLVRAEDGDLAALSTEVRIAWSLRGFHCIFVCCDPLPLCVEISPEVPAEDEEAVGVFLDPSGERSQYMAILASPTGHVLDARVENPLHHTLESEVDLQLGLPGTAGAELVPAHRMGGGDAHPL